ncbi:hypothetical protein KEM55_004168 [Ascosphaera atra]|nr:hypothetical protein KEM55_004168 [Ascosphaera atra]
MASRISPAAKLLRRSRLFSIPPPLPAPSKPLSPDPISWSPTATTAYPTHQAIVTPPSAAARGDFGLKRPLPSKATTERTSEPIVRVNKLDTFEHITDFDSATDHTRTLEKFHELELPIAKLPSNGNENFNTSRLLGSFKSVFDDEYTPKELKEAAANAKEVPVEKERYRFDGPWVTGLSEAEFQVYLKKVEKKKDEFMKFMEKRFMEHKESEQAAMLRRQQDENGTVAEAEPVKFDKKEFDEWLRRERLSPKDLGSAVFKFLDLPPVSPPSAQELAKIAQHKLPPMITPGPQNVSPAYAKEGFPKMHPSAGLSYLRTEARLLNHPHYGPQAQRPLVPSRVLRAKSAGGIGTGKASLGVAGIIAKHHGHKLNDMESLDPEVPGGPKHLSLVKRAWISPEGKVMLNAAPPPSLIAPAARPMPAYTQSTMRSVPLLNRNV